MIQRSSHNWKSKSGTWDSLNTEYVDFEGDYPKLSSIPQLSGFQTVTCNDYKKITAQSLVSMFVDDYIIERFWNHPDAYIERFKKAKYVMTPDFSLLIGMPRPMQEWNVYRNRLVGYVWQKNGVNVIPAVSWSDSSSFDFCFSGIQENGIVAISNIGCRSEEQKKYFDNGLNRLIAEIDPSKIIFQCNKKYKNDYVGENIFTFIDSFWDIKRKKE